MVERKLTARVLYVTYTYDLTKLLGILIVHVILPTFFSDKNVINMNKMIGRH